MQNYDDRKYFFLPVNTGYVDNRTPSERCIEFYEARSGYGLHCSIVGNVVIPSGFGSNNVCAEISASPNWTRLARRILEKGARPGIQLSSAWEAFNGIRSFIAQKGGDPVSEYRAAVATITIQEISRVFANLTRGTELAVSAGFNHIQCHAAHGYLFSLLVDEAFSPHSSFALEKLNEWVDQLNIQNIETSLRFSLSTGDGKVDTDDRDDLIDRLIALPFSYFDVSDGFYNINKRLIYPSTTKLLTSRREATLALAKRHPEKQFILSGRSNGAWETTLPRNVHIGICRDLIANPNFLLDRQNGCKNCNKCHYYSRGHQELECGLW